MKNHSDNDQMYIMSSLGKEIEQNHSYKGSQEKIATLNSDTCKKCGKLFSEEDLKNIFGPTINHTDLAINSQQLILKTNVLTKKDVVSAMPSLRGNHDVLGLWINIYKQN